MKKINLKTKGMHCTSCEMLVKDALEELPGVKEVSASHSSGVISVEFDESKTTKGDIIKIIKAEGYEVEK
ncbi:MAG: heavy-metal-associated domain-containing protein [archaeon]